MLRLDVECVAPCMCECILPMHGHVSVQVLSSEVAVEEVLLSNSFVPAI